jgi:hypothetical protein
MKMCGDLSKMKDKNYNIKYITEAESLKKIMLNNEKFDLVLCPFDASVRLAKLSNLIADDGMGVFGVGYQCCSNNDIKTFNQELGDYFLQSLISIDKELLVSLAIISKKKNNSIFVAEIEENSNFKNIVSNFISEKPKGNLLEGDIINVDEYWGFENYNVIKKIDRLQKKYKQYKRFYLKEVIKEINTTKDTFKEVDNALYFLKSFDSESSKKQLEVQSSIDNLSKKHSEYFQVIFDDKLVKSSYMYHYFNTEMGKLSLIATVKLDVDFDLMSTIYHLSRKSFDNIIGRMCFEKQSCFFINSIFVIVYFCFIGSSYFNHFTAGLFNDIGNSK